MPVPAIILAGGASRRLGHPKQLVVVNGETLLARTMRVAREAGAEPILVVLGGNYVAIEAATHFEHAHRIFNADWEQGIATSIRAGVEALGTVCPQASGVLLLACDQPYLTACHLRTLIEVYGGRDALLIVASRYEGVLGIPAIFPEAYFADLRSLNGDVGARHILRSHERDVACVDFVGGESDIDSPVDLAGLQARVAGNSEG